MKNIIQWLLIITLAIIISACGFHLRGREPLPESLQTIYIQTNQPYSSFTRELRQTLRAMGITIAQDIKTAPLILQVLSSNLDQQITSIGAGGQTTTYALTYTVSYQLLDRNGVTVLPIQTATTQRDHSATTNQLLGDMNTQNTLTNDMQREVIYQILNRLRHDPALKKIQ